MKKANTKTVVGPVCMTMMAGFNAVGGILSMPSGLGLFMLITAGICSVAAMMGWATYFS